LNINIGDMTIKIQHSTFDHLDICITTKPNLHLIKPLDSHQSTNFIIKAVHTYSSYYIDME